MSNTTATLTTTTVAEMPKATRAAGGDGKFEAMWKPAADDKQPRCTTFPAGTSEDDVTSFRRGLSHSCNNGGFGCSTVVQVNEDETISLFWQVRDKIVRKAAGEAATVAPSTPDTTSGNRKGRR